MSTHTRLITHFAKYLQPVGSSVDYVDYDHGSNVDYDHGSKVDYDHGSNVDYDHGGQQ